MHVWMGVQKRVSQLWEMDLTGCCMTFVPGTGARSARRAKSELPSLPHEWLILKADCFSSVSSSLVPVAMADIIKKTRRFNVLSVHSRVSSRLESRALGVPTVGLGSEFTPTLESAMLTLDPSMFLTTHESAPQYRLGPNFREVIATQLPGPLLA